MHAGSTTSRCLGLCSRDTLKARYLSGSCASLSDDASEGANVATVVCRVPVQEILAIDSKLRGCDVVALRVEDVAPNGHASDRATVRQKKTGRLVKFELADQTRQPLTTT